MTITVTQPDGELASYAVQVFVNGEKAGTIGPGETLTIKRPDASCVVRAVCGSYADEATMDGDGSLSIRWVPSAARMELSPVKNK